MFSRLKSLIYMEIDRRKEFRDDELYNYILLLAVSIVAASVHVLFTIYFAFFCVPLALGHLFGIFVFGLTTYLLLRRRFDQAGVILALMILYSSLSTIYCIGGDNFSILYQMIVLLMLSVVPFSNKRIPLIGRAVVIVTMVASHVLDLMATPPFDIGWANQALSIMNIVFTSSGVITLMSLDRHVRRVIDGYHEQQMLELKSQAYRDPLTGLYNRRYADKYFMSISPSIPGRAITVAIADLDDFKQVNDTYGHEAGDVTLKLISRTMENHLRKSDIVFRWGGEEFLLLLNDATLNQAHATLDKLRARIMDMPIEHGGHTFHITISMGVTQLSSCDIFSHIEECDRKLYCGKKSGKNVVVK